MSERVSIADDGERAARSALERCVGSGGVAVFPADGLYGLACDPLNETAVQRIQQLKGRDDRKPSAVMYFTPLAMRELVAEMGPRTREAASRLLPGPVTLVIANPRRRYPLACRHDPERLGVRLIEGPLAGAGTPVFQTSANFSGDYGQPYLVEHVPRAIRAKVDLVIDGGELSHLPSTVADISAIDVDGTWRLLRAGAKPYDELVDVLGRQRLVKRGDRFRVTRDVPVLLRITYKAPLHTGGVSAVLPRDTILVVNDQVEGYPGFGCYPEQYEKLERQLLPRKELADPKYFAYSISLLSGDIGDFLESLPPLDPPPPQGVPPTWSVEDP